MATSRDLTGVVPADPLDELRGLIGLNTVPGLIPVELRSGHPIHVATIYRWADKGCQGVKPRSTKVGSRLYTRPEWVREFLSALNRQADDATPAPAAAPAPTPAPSMRSDREVDRRLDEYLGPKRGRRRAAVAG